MEQVDEVGRLSQALSESASMQAEAVRMADQAADKVEEQKKEIEVQPHGQPIIIFGPPLIQLR